MIELVSAVTSIAPHIRNTLNIPTNITSDKSHSDWLGLSIFGTSIFVVAFLFIK